MPTYAMDGPDENVAEACPGRLLEGETVLRVVAPHSHYGSAYDAGGFFIYFDIAGQRIYSFGRSSSQMLSSN